MNRQRLLPKLINQSSQYRVTKLVRIQQITVALNTAVPAAAHHLSVVVARYGAIDGLPVVELGVLGSHGVRCSLGACS